ncbi:MAG: SDR family oxidoreductase [Bacteroidia bacterium]
MQRIAVITGGSKGIGLEIVRKFLQEGFKVISVSRSLGSLNKLQQEYGENLLVLKADMSKKEEVKRIGIEITDLHKSINVLVNNAGVFIPGEISTEEDKVFELQMALNLNAAYYISKLLIPLLKQSKDGYIFNMCSTASVIGYPNGGAYCISKHALIGMSKVLRLELMPYKIAVSSILPGATLTESWKNTELPVTRFIQASTIAKSIWFAWEARGNAVMEEILLRPVEGDF